MNTRSLLMGLALLTALAVPALAPAQTTPMVMHGNSMTMQDPHRFTGRVDAFDGHYRLVVHGMRVRLHSGTVIHPTGATIAPGQFVIIRGSWIGHHFEADEVRIRY